MTRDPNRTPDAAEIADINATHLVTTALKPADLLFVFGTRVGVAQRIATACRLWRDGFFERAIVSGGVTPGGEASEFTIIKTGMIAGGIPADFILEEHHATNTGENVIFSLPIIDAQLGRATIRSLICLGNVCTSRRYPMTVHRHWPETEKMLVVDNIFDVPLASWHTDVRFRRCVLREWDKIGPYPKRVLSRNGPFKHSLDNIPIGTYTRSVLFVRGAS